MIIDLIFTPDNGDPEKVESCSLPGIKNGEPPDIIQYRGKVWRRCLGYVESGTAVAYREVSFFALAHPEDPVSVADQAIELLESAITDFAKLKPFAGEIGPRMAELYGEYLKTLKPSAGEEFCPTCAATRRFRVALHDMVRLQPKDETVVALYRGLNEKLTSILKTCPHRKGPETDITKVPRSHRPALGGDTQTVLPTDWKLHMCVQASGREALIDWGPEDVMRVELQKQFNANRDVWLIAPDGTKYLPANEQHP